MATSILVKLTVAAEELDHDALTAQLGKQPTQLWHKGDAIGKSVLRRQDDGWVFAQGPVESFELEDDLLSLFKAFDHAVLRAVGAEYELEVGCVVTIEARETPVINLSVETLQLLHEMHAELDIDLQVGE